MQPGKWQREKVRPPPTSPKFKIGIWGRTTPAEAKLWSRLRNDQLGVSFRRQHAIDKYIPDFYCPSAKLIIELDGGAHLDQQEHDKERTRYLESQGYKVIRFWNHDVMNNIEGVIRAIMHALEGGL